MVVPCLAFRSWFAASMLADETITARIGPTANLDEAH
jgi:hypothetical protein